jgi:hypothetical protein
MLKATSGGTIKIRGREYSWEPTKTSKGEDAYILKGKKGADYMTMRNVHTPAHMFIISRKAIGTPAGMKGVWRHRQERDA